MVLEWRKRLAEPSRASWAVWQSEEQGTFKIKRGLVCGRGAVRRARPFPAAEAPALGQLSRLVDGLRQSKVLCRREKAARLLVAVVV